MTRLYRSARVIGFHISHPAVAAFEATTKKETTTNKKQTNKQTQRRSNEAKRKKARRESVFNTESKSVCVEQTETENNKKKKENNNTQTNKQQSIHEQRMSCRGHGKHFRGYRVLLFLPLYRLSLLRFPLVVGNTPLLSHKALLLCKHCPDCQRLFLHLRGLCSCVNSTGRACGAAVLDRVRSC